MSGATQARTCMRCLTRRPATTTGHFSYENYMYEIELCDMHAHMFDTDMANWMRLARDVGPLISVVNNTVVPFPVTKGGEIRRDDDYPGPCPSSETAKWRPRAWREAQKKTVDDDVNPGHDYTARVLMQPATKKEA